MEPLRIIIDTREQAPWSWNPSDAVTEYRALAAGDYALASDCESISSRKTLSVRFAIERKSLDDFLGTISSGWERFRRELTRMESFPARVIIVEGDFASVCFGGSEHGITLPQHNHPNLTPSFVARRIAELTLDGVSVLFAGNDQMAAGLAFRIFKRRIDLCQL